MRWFIFLIAPVIVGIDQYTKWWIRQTIPEGGRIEVIPDFFNLTHVQNPGAAFGMMRNLDSSIREPIFLIVSVFAFLILFYLYHQSHRDDLRMRVALLVIFSGAVGNVIDRVLFGQVTDFLDFYFRDYHWANFNVADSCITVGVIFLFIEMLFFSKEMMRPKEEQTETLAALPEEDASVTDDGPAGAAIDSTVTLHAE